jgi:hypothetical protein
VGLVAQKGEPLRRIELPGLPGFLTSTSTRIPGLISADDLGHLERLGSISVRDAEARVTRLQHRFEQLHSGRRWANVMLAALPIAAILGALLLRTELAGRFCVAIAPVMVGVSLMLSLAGAARPVVLLPALGLGSVALAAAVAVPRRAIAYLGPALLLLFLVVLWAWPETAGFAAIGPRPEEGGRFFGISNVVETVLLTISLYSGAELGLRALMPLGALALVTVGWSRTGADGGGLIVFAAAFALLALRLAGRITLRRLALAGLGGVGVVLAFIGIDKASGGHSHITRAFERGPGAWFVDIGHRLHLSADRLNHWHVALIVAVSLIALVWLAFQRPRSPALDALLVGLAVSLVANDAPGDIAAAGAISGFVLWASAATRYTRARAPARPDPDGSSPPRGRMRRRGHDPAAP